MPLPDFHNVIFPEDISYGSSGGPGFNTSVIELASGAEQRNVNWKQQRAEYDVSHGVKTRDQMEHLVEFFTARRGKAYGFRFKDWMDFTIDRQALNLTTGLTGTRQIYKRYEPETDYFFDRPITKIMPGTASIWIDGALVGDPDSILDYDTGIITVGNGSVCEIECEFHVPVRFDTDTMKISHDDWEQMSWPSIPLVELKARI
jgi:uncharacterized protein (TIGR02217 family)